MINKWQFCAAKLAESANYASSTFFGKYIKMLVMTIMQKLCQHNLSKRSLPNYLSISLRETPAASPAFVF